MTCRVAGNAIIDDGQSGWRVYPVKSCPWEKAARRCIGTAIFGGYCGYDFICGTCGSYWSEEDGIGYRKLTNDQREANIARVTAFPDPECWECHDSGDVGTPLNCPGENPCTCPARPSDSAPHESSR